jgi:hypothetical protein
MDGETLKTLVPRGRGAERLPCPRLIERNGSEADHAS